MSATWTRSRGTVALVLTAALALALVVGGQPSTAIAAEPSGSGSITGQVAFPAGVDRSTGDTYAFAYRNADEWGFNEYAYGAAAEVAADGTYQIRGLAAGSYKVKFVSDETLGVLDVWNGGSIFSSDAAPLNVAEQGAKAGVDVTLHRPATISGIAPYYYGRSVTVLAYASDDAEVGARTWSEAHTAPDGSYALTGLPAGDYKVRFFDAGFFAGPGQVGRGVPRLDQWWSTTGEQGDTIDVIDLGWNASRNGIDGGLAGAVSIAGRVTFPDGADAEIGSTTVIAAGEQDSYVVGVKHDGTYRFAALPAGDYTVSVNTTVPGALNSSYDVIPGGAPTTLSLVPGQVATGIDVALPAAATISGTVRPAGGITVRAESVEPAGVVRFAEIDEDGDYTIDGLPAGDYRLAVIGAGRKVEEQWYPGVSESDDAGTVSISAGQHAKGYRLSAPIDRRSGWIAGTVTFPAGVDTSVGWTRAVAHCTGERHPWTAAETVGADGSYLIDGIPTESTCTLEFISSGRAVFDSLWADPTTPDEPLTLTFDDANAVADPTLRPSAMIAGTVTMPSARSDLHASVRTSDGTEVASSRVASDGSYSVAGLEPGTYKIGILGDTGEVLDAWWGGAAAVSAAATLTLAATETRSGADVTVTRGASVSGTVTPPSGVEFDDWPIARVVRASDGEEVGQAFVEDDGSYRVSKLPPGTYKVAINATSATLAAWWGGGSEASAAPVSLTSGQARAGLDVTAPKAGSLSGRIHFPAGENTWGSRVTVHASDGSTVGTDEFDDGDGAFFIGRLAPGDYTLRFWNGDSVEAWWHNATSSFDAATLTVAPGQDRQGINTTLIRGAKMTGRVSFPAGVDLTVGGTQVNVTPVGSLASRGTTVKADGTYELGGLPPGTYTVRFQSWGRAVTDQWWNGAADEASAATVTLYAGEQRTGVDAALGSTGPRSLAAATPVVAGTVAVGSTVSAKPGAWTAGTAFAYQWYSNGSPIKGATKSTLKLGSGQKGTKISVRVTGTRTGFTSTAKTSAATAKVATVGTPKISGTAKVGKRLTAKPGTWTSGTRFSYQWYANGVAIKKATKSTLTLKSAQKGKKITVKVTGKKSGYATVAKTAAKAGKVR